VLALPAQSPITRATAIQAVADLFQLTSEERQERIPSGQDTYIHNRVGWAMTYMTKAGLLEKAASRTYTAAIRGRDFLNKFPDRFGVKELLVIPATPHERIDAALDEINGSLRSQLLAALLKMTLRSSNRWCSIYW
jgi:restriction endonuclease Mrr